MRPLAPAPAPALAIALALVLAGCARMPEPEATDGHVVSEPRWTYVDTECPAFLDIDRPGEDAPRWRPGQWWNYTLLDEDGLARGYVLEEVRGCGDVNGTPVWRVQQTFLEYGTTSGYAEIARVDDHYLAMETLNELWAACGKPYIIGDCEGRTMEWDFPLEDGKRWSYGCCGDVISTVYARSELTSEGTWRILHSQTEGGAPYRTWIYDPSLGLFSAKIGDWWNGPGRWELRSHGMAPVPQRVLAPREGGSWSIETACAHEEARAPSGTATVRGAWDASPEGTIVRLSRALNETLVGEPRVEGASLAWNASSGSVYEVALREGPVVATWRAPYDPLPRSGPGGEAWLRNVLDRFAFQDAAGIDVRDVASMEGYSFHYGQRVDGVVVTDAGGHVFAREGTTTMRWGPIHDLPEPAVGFDDALAIAKAYHRCAMDRRGLTESQGYALERTSEGASFVVRDASLAYEIGLTYARPGNELAHCPLSESVLVDAVTGAIIGHRAPEFCF